MYELRYKSRQAYYLNTVITTRGCVCVAELILKRLRLDDILKDEMQMLRAEALNRQVLYERDPSQNTPRNSIPSSSQHTVLQPDSDNIFFAGSQQELNKQIGENTGDNSESEGNIPWHTSNSCTVTGRPTSNIGSSAVIDVHSASHGSATTTGGHTFNSGPSTGIKSGEHISNSGTVVGRQMSSCNKNLTTDDRHYIKTADVGECEIFGRSQSNVRLSQSRHASCAVSGESTAAVNSIDTLNYAIKRNDDDFEDVKVRRRLTHKRLKVTNTDNSSAEVGRLNSNDKCCDTQEGEGKKQLNIPANQMLNFIASCGDWLDDIDDSTSSCMKQHTVADVPLLHDSHIGAVVKEGKANTAGNSATSAHNGVSDTVSENPLCNNMLFQFLKSFESDSGFVSDK